MQKFFKRGFRGNLDNVLTGTKNSSLIKTTTKNLFKKKTNRTTHKNININKSNLNLTLNRFSSSKQFSKTTSKNDTQNNNNNKKNETEDTTNKIKKAVKDSIPEQTKIQTSSAKTTEKQFSNQTTNTKTAPKIPEDIVTPWEVIGKVDYMKLVIKFGTELLDESLITRFEKLTNKPIHPWIKRNIFFTHRGLNTILTALENNEKVFLYTGRGPSSDSMHLGHLIPFIFTKWLQESLNSVLVIQISDEEKFAFKKRSFDEIYNLGKNNAKDIAAIGFDPNKTFIFSNRDYRLRCAQYEILASELKVNTSANEIKKIFGFTDEASIAMMDWPFYQTAAAYYQAFPNIFGGKAAYCLVPHAIDQDPYFRLARDLSGKVGKYRLIKPCNIMSKFVPPLSGDSGKMSSSTAAESTIFLSDSVKEVKEKVFKYTYSGGGGDGTLLEHKKFGGNADKDMAFQYLRYFEYDEAELERIKVGFTRGVISCSEIKEILCEKIIGVLGEIQANRAKVTDETMALFYDDKNKYVNNANYNGNFNENNFNKEDTNASGLKWNFNYEGFYRNDNDCFYGRKKLNEKQAKLILELKGKYGIEDFEVKFHDHLSIKENEIELKNLIKGNLTKTLFLKGSGSNYFILIIDYDEVVNLKNLKKKLKLQSLKFGENDTIKHLFDVNKSEFGFLSALNLNEIKDKIFSILISESLKEIEHFNFPFVSEESHIAIKQKDIIKLLEMNNYNFSFV